MSDSDNSDDSDHLPSSDIAAPASATQAVAAVVALRVVHQRIAAAAIEDNSATVLVCIAPARTFFFTFELQASSAAICVANGQDVLPALLSGSDGSNLPSSAIAASASETQVVASAVARVEPQRISAAAIEDNLASDLVCFNLRLFVYNCFKLICRLLQLLIVMSLLLPIRLSSAVTVMTVMVPSAAALAVLRLRQSDIAKTFQPVLCNESFNKVV